ncbi:MAG: glycosyltransferase family 39 protein [Myxococcota bacterium]|nr:glycosyltransferase family 39 protein [Myxococcota bacterium]
MVAKSNEHVGAIDGMADGVTPPPGRLGHAGDHEARGGIAQYLATQPRSFRGDWPTIVGLMLALTAFYMPGIGSYGLYDPWETHYGEVARNMVEADNYIDPFWGAAWDSGGVKRERHAFYSKPPLIMWMMSAGINLFGFNEFGVRFFFPLLMMLALVSVYLAVSRFYCRRVGLLATLVSTTTPYIAMMSRQAVTDGPLVAFMTIGMMCLGLALFKIDRTEHASTGARWVVGTLLALIIIGQLWAILPMDRSPDVVRPYVGHQGPFFAIQWWFTEIFTVGAGKGWVVALITLPLVVWTFARLFRQRSRQLIYVYLFYICCGLVVPTKGWLGWAPMGLAIVGYLCISGEWRRLLDVDVPTGLLIVALTGHLWVLAMLTGHHPAWWNRFIIHDHYKRLFAGVHSIDSGGFEYFFRWIGYGLFPWIGLLPMAIVRCFAGLREQVRRYSPRQRFEVLLLLWAVGGFFLFSKSSTKFHHYILPVVPPLSILVALYLDDVLARRARLVGILLPCAAALTIWVGQDTYRMPQSFAQGSQNWVNLFTYKYDRQWAKYTPPEAMEKLDATKQE